MAQDVSVSSDKLVFKIVVIMSMVVRLAPRAASKNLGLKKVVTYVVIMRRKVGRYVVKTSLLYCVHYIVYTIHFSFTLDNP